MRKGDGDMKEKKRVWFTFNLCEADAFEQYLEKMAYSSVKNVMDVPVDDFCS